MNLKNKMIFAILSFAIATLMLSVSSNSLFKQQTLIPTSAQENEAEVEADIEQENKCKKDTDCENENEINNSLNIINKTETGIGQLNVTKIVTCEFVFDSNGFTHTILQGKPAFSKIQFVPVGDPCDDQRVIQEIEPQDFEFTVTGNNPNPSTFPGSDSGVIVTLGAGSYDVEESNNIPSILAAWTVDIETTETGDCSSSIGAGESKSCIFTNDITLRLAPDT